MASNSSFVASGSNQTVLSALVTLVFLNPKASPSHDFEFIRWWCGESTDVVSKSTRIQLSTQVTAFPTVVGITPAQLNQVDVASVLVSGVGGVGTVGINASAENAGAKTIVWPDQFNNVNGWLLLPTPEERYELAGGGAAGIGMVFPVAVTPLAGWTFGAVYREI